MGDEGLENVGETLGKKRSRENVTPNATLKNLESAKIAKIATVLKSHLTIAQIGELAKILRNDTIDIVPEWSISHRPELSKDPLERSDEKRN